MSKKQFFLAISPLLLFALLIVPYSWLNQTFLVDWLGCGCPQLDAFGNLYEPLFNANDFTACFWLLVAVAAGILAFFLSRRLFPNKVFTRFVYIGAIAVVSLFFAFYLYQLMMWN